MAGACSNYGQWLVLMMATSCQILWLIGKSSFMAMVPHGLNLRSIIMVEIKMFPFLHSVQKQTYSEAINQDVMIAWYSGTKHIYFEVPLFRKTPGYQVHDIRNCSHTWMKGVVPLGIVWFLGSPSSTNDPCCFMVFQLIATSFAVLSTADSAPTMWVITLRRFFAVALDQYKHVYSWCIP